MRLISDAIETLDRELGNADRALSVSRWELGEGVGTAHNALQSLVGITRGVIESLETV